MKSAHAYILGNLAQIATGHPIRVSIDELPAGRTGVVQMRNLNPERGVDWPAVARVELPASRKTEWLTGGDVIFTTRGGRHSAVAIEEPPFPAVCSPHFFVLRVLRDAIDPRFLAWQINQGPAQDYLQMSATGSYIQNIKREVIERLELIVPSRERQGAIVAFADAAERERRLLSELVDLRQQQMNALAEGLRHPIKESA